MCSLRSWKCLNQSVHKMTNFELALYKRGIFRVQRKVICKIDSLGKVKLKNSAGYLKYQRRNLRCPLTVTDGRTDILSHREASLKKIQNPTYEVYKKLNKPTIDSNIIRF